jgi:uracil-DNA glycosylase
VTADDLPAAFASVPPAWADCLPGWTPHRCAALVDAVRRVSGDRLIGPPDPFRALRLVAPDAVRVLVFGQDPYPTPGHADGLAFSAARGRPVSLRRLQAVLSADRPDYRPPSHGRLDGWAHQGVLLLNPVLTVELGRAGSHLDVGWQALTAEVVVHLMGLAQPPAVLLWGSKAQSFFDMATRGQVVRASVWRTRHPSHDFQRQFMAEGSHFLATSHLIDWWKGEAGGD